MNPTDILESIFVWLTGQVMLAALETFQMLMSWWVGDAYTQNLADGKGAGGVLYFLRSHTNWLTALMAFAGFAFAALRAAVQRKGEPFRVAFSNFFELAVIVLMLATVVQLASLAADEYSSWVLAESMPKDGNWAKEWTEELNGVQQAGSLFLFAIFGIFVLISSLIQWGLMLFRSAAMVVLVGLLPLLAASRFSSYGEYAYKRALGWLISWWAYGPIVATGAAAGQQLLQSKYQTDKYAGMALIIGMVFALPAVFSAIMPAVRDDNNSFSPRQVGHFMFGGTAVNVGRRTGIWSGTTDRINERRRSAATAANPQGGLATGGAAPGGGTAGGRRPNGGNPNGGAPNNAPPNGGPPNGRTPNGGPPSGGSPSGNTSNGNTSNGSTPNGGSPSGGPPGGSTSGTGTPGTGTPGAGTPGAGTPGTGRRTPTGAPDSGGALNSTSLSGAVPGGSSGHASGGAPPGGGTGGQRGGAGAAQVDGPSGAETVSSLSSLPIPQSVPPYEREAYESPPKFDSDFQRPSLSAAINQYRHPSGGDAHRPQGGGDVSNMWRGPSGAD